MPHYRVGYALYNYKNNRLSEFLLGPTGGGLEAPHAIMHNNMHFSMNHGLFSITNLMFFPYHSWIDAMLEMKIRLCEPKGEGLNIAVYLREPIQQQTFDVLLSDYELA